MGPSRDHLEERHLLERGSVVGSVQSDDDDDYDYTTSEYELGSIENGKGSQYIRRLPRLPLWWSRRRPGRSRSPLSHFTLSAVRRRRSLPLCAVQTLALFGNVVVCLVIFVGLLLPSYTNPPQHYTELQQRVQQSELHGRGNIHNEKLFIAAAVHDGNGELLGGDWGARLLGLIDVLGPDNVFLSIYENDADEQAQLALETFAKTVPCNKSIVHEHLDLAQLPHVVTPSGVSRLKRIAFLAEVRNRALRPLDDPTSLAHNIRFDKVLYVNDVFFEPVDAANLLFSTNVDEHTRKTDYRAACSVDFINPFKFYDTFATRDTEGFQMGVPFFPWFAASGNSTSRIDVLSQKDAVRVKSCWGGMVAFEAKWLQPRMHLAQIDIPANATTPSPLRFRAEPDTYWDSSECCLIHADLALLLDDPEQPGIYMNPYIRVAYSAQVLHWLHFTRRFERLYTWVQHLVNLMSARPGYNPRRTQQVSEEVIDKVWVWDERSRHVLQNLGESGLQLSKTAAKSGLKLNGSWQEVTRTATAGQFCGMRGLLYINEHPKEGETSWSAEQVP